MRPCGQLASSTSLTLAEGSTEAGLYGIQDNAISTFGINFGTKKS